MKLTFYILGSFLLSSILFICIIISINKFMFKETEYITPLLLESDENIEKVLMELTPIGTSMEDVLEVIKENEEWKIDSISYEEGFLETFPDGYYRVGEKHISGILGMYENPSLTYVLVFWGFDKDAKLMFIHVRTDEDSL